MDYKDTLNLPKTEFPMKAELPKKEPQLLEKWLKQDIRRLILEKSKGKEKYILHDGPPYANGDIHIGHALNKTLKDIIVKYKTMQGFDSSYVPGWDCHGLPIEHQLFKELKIHKSQIGQLEFRKKAYDYAERYVAVQKEQFKRLGVFGDWENPYLTLSHEYEESIIASFAELVKKGYIYRGLKPVNWCFKCETALAEAEVEYEEHISPSIYVRFELSGVFGPLGCEKGKEAACLPPGQDKGKTYLLIWTTTPWTLAANVAVAVHPDFTYSYIQTEKGRLLIAKDLLPSVLANIGVAGYEVIAEVKGSELKGLTYNHPFLARTGCLVLAGYVSREEGTGLVHTAPGHGSEDYATGLKYKLDIIMPVDAKGNFDASAADLAGMNIYEANKKILEKLDSSSALLFNSELAHSYPHCWRCKSPVIFRATKQWFLKMDHLDLRSRLIEAIKNRVRWIPQAGQERITSMVELRPDWCLSRQRYWGVPIPALACLGCKEEVLDSVVIDNFKLFVAKEGTDAWFKYPVEKFLPAGMKCPYCGENKFSKGSDILDVWFDSGVSHQAVLKKRQELEFPCSLYLEGSDQHRGWFQSSLIPAVSIDEKPPFKSVLTHGFVVDAAGRKMSKSLGNVISPQEVIKDYGADILRLWVASSDYNEDIRVSSQILARLAEAYRKIRNTCRFCLSNLYDFNPKKDKLTAQDLNKLDCWILMRFRRMLERVSLAYDSFQFYRAYKSIYDFCNEDMSMYYLDMVKGRLYTYACDSRQRRSAQTAVYRILHALIRVFAPLLVFSADEIWQHLPKEEKEEGITSVHLLDWPDPLQFPEEEMGLESLIELIPDITKALEEKRAAGAIGSSFEAQINILTKEQIRYKYLESLAGELPEVFKVSGVRIKHDACAGPFSIEVGKAAGSKCPRCWNYFIFQEDKNQGLVCKRCLKAMEGRAG